MLLSIRTWYRSLVKEDNGAFRTRFWRPEGHYVSYSDEPRSVAELQRDGLERFHQPENGRTVSPIRNGYVVRERHSHLGVKLVQAVTIKPEPRFFAAL